MAWIQPMSEWIHVFSHLSLQWVACTLDPLSCHHVLNNWEITLWQKINMRTQITFHWITMLFIPLVGNKLQFFENLLQVCSMKYEDEECHRSNILFTEKLHRQSWTANHLILLVSSSLPLHADWKFRTGCVGHWGLPAPQPHVLFSECTFNCGCLLFLSNYPQNVSRLYVKEQSHFLPWMSNTDVPCCYFWDHRMLFLLAAMAYDRYVAIYDPLLYLVSMAPRVYVPLIIVSCVGGVLHASVHTVATFRLSFYGSNEIRHVFCDIPPLLDISCSDTHTNQLLLFYFAGSIEIVTVLIVLISYGFILLTVLRMPSAVGRRKVFSTCGSHLTGVSICHGTVLFMYVRPSSSYATDHNMIVSIIYSIVIPMLNPIIYSLRNKDVKEAMKSVCKKILYQ